MSGIGEKGFTEKLFPERGDMRAFSNTFIPETEIIQKAIDYEVVRQIEAVETGERIIQETRNFDPATGRTSGMREKESMNDYRYFPEPDLPPVIVTQAYIEGIKANMPALPDGWVECNGQTLSDAASPLNGTAMPNLNGTFTTEAGGTSSAGRFLRGGATSGTFASDRTNSVTEMLIEDNGGGQASQRSIPDNGSWSAAGYNYYTTGSNDGIKLRKKGVETNPGSMTVVWIMKVK